MVVQFCRSSQRPEIRGGVGGLDDGIVFTDVIEVWDEDSNKVRHSESLNCCK